jgi:RIO-like serine/threonine protein kinase
VVYLVEINGKQYSMKEKIITPHELAGILGKKDGDVVAKNEINSLKLVSGEYIKYYGYSVVERDKQYVLRICYSYIEGTDIQNTILTRDELKSCLKCLIKQVLLCRKMGVVHGPHDMIVSKDKKTATLIDFGLSLNTQIKHEVFSEMYDANMDTFYDFDELMILIQVYFENKIAGVITATNDLRKHKFDSYEVMEKIVDKM